MGAQPNPDIMDFEGQHIIITGGSSGIGLATAQQLVQLGSHITIIARHPAQLEGAQSAISTAKIHSEQRVLGPVSRCERSPPNHGCH